MTTETARRRYGMAAIGFFLAGALVYAVMVTVTLSHIEAVSNQVPFDMRPFGYSPQEAGALLAALGEEGRMYYLTRQIPLDTLYPALLAMTLVSSILFFTRRWPGSMLAGIGIAFSVSAALFDYAENLGIAMMILCWPDLSHGVVHAANAATIAKSGSTTAALAIAFLIGSVWFRRREADT